MLSKLSNVVKVWARAVVIKDEKAITAILTKRWLSMNSLLARISIPHRSLVATQAAAGMRLSGSQDSLGVGYNDRNSGHSFT